MAPTVSDDPPPSRAPHSLLEPFVYCPFCHKDAVRFWSCELASEFRCASCAAPLRRQGGRGFNITKLVLVTGFGAFHRYFVLPEDYGLLVLLLLLMLALSLLRRKFERYVPGRPPAAQ